ncbi:MAG: DUF5009 domain-containing protein, partial [Gemmatimonadota bacterium]
MTENPQSARLQSIDVVRGLTVLAMMFVNDLAGVTGVPAWLKHIQPSRSDGMTLVDVVFPAFLFIVGLAIPFALEARQSRGESLWGVWRHVLARVAGLLVIGVFMVNNPASEGAALDPDIWRLLMYAGVLVAWNDWGEPGRRRWLLRGLGAAILVVAAVLYRGKGDPAFIELRTQWWGILGLIGWAYLVGCAAYTLCRRDLGLMVGAIGLLYSVYLAAGMGYFDGLWITQYVGIGSALGSHGAITVAGVVLGTMLGPRSPLGTHGSRIGWGILFAAGLAAAGILLHTLHDVHRMFIFNKNAATPPWCLVSSAITAALWVAVYWLVDARGWRRWTAVVEPAGRNALFAYILAPILYALFPLL